MTLEELRARLREIEERLAALDSEYAGRSLEGDARTEWNTLNEEREEKIKTVDELVARAERISEFAGRSEGEPGDEPRSFLTARPGSARGSDIYDLSEIRASVGSPEEATREMQDRAKRAIEVAQFPHEGANREDTQEHIERLLASSDDQRGSLARRLLVTGSPVYQRAFGKALAGRPLSDSEQRALSLADAGGGFAVPFTLDPTIIPTSNGAVNPLRTLARVETITNDEWKGVSSAGITASYATEGAEAGDNAPTLAQPSVKPVRAQAFVPFSIEVGQDWGGLQSEVARLLQDAKDELEADKFINGDGSDEPEGIVAGLAAGSQIETAGNEAFAVGDVYALEEALPPRFRQLAQFVANRAIYNKVRQFDTSGGADLWIYLRDGLKNQPSGNTGAQLIGYGANEASEMDSAVASPNEILLLGDFRHYLIVDRIGMSVELIQHLMGANRRPTGQRGIYAIWRNSATILADEAFRLLKVNAA